MNGSDQGVTGTVRVSEPKATAGRRVIDRLGPAQRVAGRRAACARRFRSCLLASGAAAVLAADDPARAAEPDPVEVAAVSINAAAASAVPVSVAAPSAASDAESPTLAEPVLIGLDAIDMLGDGRARVRRPAVLESGSAVAGSENVDLLDLPAALAPPATTRPPASIPVPGALGLFLPGAIVAAYAGRRLRARCSRRA